MAVQISGNDITVPRDGSFTRNVTIGGTLTYEDVTNIDSVGLVTARQGIEIGASPGVAASISVDGNMIVSGISTFDGRVLIGTTTEGEGDADDLTIATSGNTGITIRSGTSNDGAIFFSDGTSGTDEYKGTIQYLHSSDAFLFKTAATERGRIESAGNVKIEKNLNVVGVCTATSFSGSGANLTGISAITMIDSWRMTTSTSNGTNATIENWAAATNKLNSSLGTALGYSSGIFSFPSTGHYLLTFGCRFHCSSGNDGTMSVFLQVTENNSSYSDAALTSYGAQEGDTKATGSITYAFDITDTSNQKFKFITDSFGSSSQLMGASTENQTYFQIVRLADT